ncbi:hypothetical protein KZO01_11270 [Kurthia zopfii]|uniref:Uncharacterized protein conserved in bacteria n=1 Tax=Kurthia zopfii TaxID=1650 RepID=A0A8B4QER4_9BACL|nr:DUF4870 domain-containing protein [Kurthia zopfii]PWI22129.1 DUF4870 domain-containing protein [Kurthia zopfii]TDR37011.1 hypothetical protein DFR61_1211 [Kurthia zopfii]GEK30818.1 hypothetical protein KZO01_11270 [Kurthia zopfii]STX11165.1 Uncharacterized protein conserved in bacteria [Kurthia zopfii]
MEDNKWIKVILHASAFFAPFLVPILFMLLIQDDRVKSLSIQALLFQVVMYVLMAISGVLSFILIGIPFLIVFGIMTVVVPIIGIVNAISEKDWQYPIVGRWV